MSRRQDEVLNGVREWLGRYVLTVNDSDLDLLTLWCAHTHLVNETYSSPRLLIDSPMPGSGKTTALEHMARLCVSPVQMAAVSSAALLVRLLQDSEGNHVLRTLLIDEVDRTLRPDKETTPDLIAILNSGYKRGATRPVLVPVKGGGWASQEMPTFAPVAMAGNSPQLPDDTRTRTIRVLLLPDLEGAVEESDWEMIEPDAVAMGEWLAQWAERVRPIVAGDRPGMPEGIVGRFREKWQPLARVAAAAGGRWPQVVAALAVADKEQVEADRADGMLTERPHIVLLKHLAKVWPPDESFQSTADLVADLQAMFPESWGPKDDRYPAGLTVQRLGRMMASHYKVNTGRLNVDQDRTRGYFLADLAPVWRRMGVHFEPAKPDEVDEPGTNPPALTGSTGSTGSAGSIPAPPALTGSTGSTGSAGSIPAHTGHCDACGQVLDVSSIDDGFTTCPTCPSSLLGGAR